MHLHQEITSTGFKIVCTDCGNLSIRMAERKAAATRSSNAANAARCAARSPTSTSWLAAAATFSNSSPAPAMTPAQDAAMPNKATMESVWSILEAANDLGDASVVEACRRIIDADLRGAPPEPADLNAIAGLFG
jgi:hypothetical protein